MSKRTILINGNTSIYTMELDLLEKLSKNWKKSKDSQIEKKIINLICNNNNTDNNRFAFPIAENCLISNGRVGFTYKDNKTYPYLFEFLAYITNREIPIEIKNCHFGPGEIVVLRDNKEDAIGDLIISTNEIVNEIKTKFNN
jgi:hypothetical protein